MIQIYTMDYTSEVYDTYDALSDWITGRPSYRLHWDSFPDICDFIWAGSFELPSEVFRGLL